MTRDYNNMALMQQMRWQSGQAVEKAVKEERERLFAALMEHEKDLNSNAYESTWGVKTSDIRKVFSKEK